MATSSGSRGPYAKSARIREQIVAAAMDVFAQTGFRAGTMKEIAHRAGISQRGLVHHFSTKEELLDEVLTTRAVESARLMRIGPAAEALNSVVAIMADNTRRPGLVELHSVITAEATSPDHPAHTHHAERLRSWRAYLTTVFAELEASGALVPGVTPELAAATLVAIQDGIQLQWLYEPDAIDMARTVAGYIASIAPGLELGHRVDTG